MLGPSILFAGPPFSAGYAFHACRRAHGKFVAGAGLVVAILELIALAVLFAVAVYCSL